MSEVEKVSLIYSIVIVPALPSQKASTLRNAHFVSNILQKIVYYCRLWTVEAMLSIFTSQDYAGR